MGRAKAPHRRRAQRNNQCLRIFMRCSFPATRNCSLQSARWIRTCKWDDDSPGEGRGLFATIRTPTGTPPARTPVTSSRIPCLPSPCPCPCPCPRSAGKGRPTPVFVSPPDTRHATFLTWSSRAENFSTTFGRLSSMALRPVFSEGISGTLSGGVALEQGLRRRVPAVQLDEDDTGDALHREAGRVSADRRVPCAAARPPAPGANRRDRWSST